MNGVVDNIPEPVLEESYIKAKDYEIRIEILDRGCIIRIGCKSIAFEDVNVGLTNLKNWINNPKETYASWKQILKL